MSDDAYTKKLESVIKQMLAPLHDLPFRLVIEGISGKRVIPFDPEDSRDAKVLEGLKAIAKLGARLINAKGIRRRRANEVGNDVEGFVSQACSELKIKCDKPSTQSGKKRSMGYPDLVFLDEFARPNYLECKTFNNDSLGTTLRSFYLSPSDDFKVTHDAHHFAISYQMEVVDKVGEHNIYKCQSWKILDLYKLDVDVKYEFNSDNRRLYDKKLILAEGIVV